MDEDSRRFISAGDLSKVQQWEEETPTGRRLPRKLGKATKGKRNVDYR